MLFVSPAWARPLRLVDSAQAESEAFLVPNFGGVAVLNKVPRLGASAQLSALELAQPMGVFLAQLRTMLGLPPPPPPLGAGACAAASDPLEPCRLAPPSNGGVADWEREMLRRRVTQTHVEKAMRALRSLEALLQSVPFMPMDAAVSQRLEMSVRLLEAAARHAESGAREEALGAAQAAAASATQAFFDPSMLPLLYLPPDQVAAVFAPFFLPVVLHLAISLLRWRRGKT
jgi:phosphatidylinositol glycan class S